MENINPPVKGQPIRAAWAASLTDAVNRHDRQLMSRIGGDPYNKRRDHNAPHPFYIYGACDNPGAGGEATFIIYLPHGSIVYGTTVLTPTGVTAYQGAEDRYTIDSGGIGEDIGDSPSTAVPLYLVIYTPSSGTVTATFTTELSDIPSGSTIHSSIPVADIFACETDAGDIYGGVARQLVNSVVLCNAITVQPAPEFNHLYKLKVFGNHLCVYLGTNGYSYALCIAGTYVTIANLTEEPDQTGWYYVCSADQNRFVYLRIVSSTNGYSASIANSVTQGAAWNIVIGKMDVIGGSGSSVRHDMCQVIVGGICLGSGGGISSTTQVDVVTDVAYSESTHACTQTKRKLTVLANNDPSTYQPTVFQATDHANEHS